MSSAISSFRQSAWFSVAPALVYLALIFVGGSIPMPELPEAAPKLSDKLMHFVAFGGMQILMFRAVRYRRPAAGPGAQNALAAVICCAAGALLEFWQAALPHRSAEFADWLADCIGVALGAALVALVVRTLPAVQPTASEPADGSG